MITFKAKESSGEIINSALHPFNFPAGEAHTKQTEGRDLQPVEIAIFQPTPESMHDDLFQIAMWTEVVHNGRVNSKRPKSVLIMPYVPGARADRGVPFGLDVYANFINGLVIDQIIIFDPHSEVTAELLKGHKSTTIVYSDELFDQPHMRAVLNGYTGIIAPDKGAAFRAQAVADVAGLPVYTATKERDEETGRLSNFQIDLPDDGTFLIIDDICDGGGTFLGLLAASGKGMGMVDLYVSHGVFSKEAQTNLSDKFEFIFTTNSYNPTRDLNDFLGSDAYPAFRRFDVIRLLESKIIY